EIPQIYYRLTPGDYLKGLARAWFTAGGEISKPWEILRGHLVRGLGRVEYVDFAEEFGTEHIAEKVLQPDAAGRERYDFINSFFTIDHQHHVDPHPENLVRRMVRLDRRLGRILRAVERSQRRDQTLVVLLSDHGSEYLPGAINLAFPLTRAFRTRHFGGHNVATVMAEDAAHALTTPIPSVDFPRVYESPFSPYSKAAPGGGQEGYPTAFIDNFGNARAEVHLRNNDLNRLHLLLLRRRRKLDEDQRARWRVKLRATLGALCGWLEAERARYHDYHESVKAWLPNLERRGDRYWRDVAFRLRDEYERDAKRLRRLDRLAELCAAEEPVRWVYERDDKISRLIPKKYFGPRNSIYQLSHYTIGLDEQMNWIETTVDQRGRTVPMNYFRVLASYEAPNPPLSHEPNPVDLIVTRLPVAPVREALAARGWPTEDLELRQVIWIVSTAKDNLRRGVKRCCWKRPTAGCATFPLAGSSKSPRAAFASSPTTSSTRWGCSTTPPSRAKPASRLSCGWSASTRSARGCAPPLARTTVSRRSS
ncbi:MAG: alkaline phosphatase family protein, partial [Terriglobia bacterium]